MHFVSDMEEEGIVGIDRDAISGETSTFPQIYLSPEVELKKN